MILRLFLVTCAMVVSCSRDEEHKYEAMSRNKHVSKIIKHFKFVQPEPAYAYPEPLPTEKPIPNCLSHNHNIYQGSRKKGDKRIYDKKFQYGPTADGHLVTLRGNFDCKLTHIKAESSEGTPIILRGGAGSYYFNIIVKAGPGMELVGRVQAFCMKLASQDDDEDEEIKHIREERKNKG